MTHLIAIDGGGTGCRALVANAGGHVLGRGAAGAANILSDPDGSHRSILQAAERAIAEAGLAAGTIGSSDAVLGLAGANAGTQAEAIRARLPFRNCVIETDAVIAMHGALGRHDGVVATLGTGSVFVARLGERVRVVGGWGFKVGDQASGARLGRALLEEVLLAHDGIRPGSALATAVLEEFGGSASRIVEFAHEARPGDFATFAPRIFDAADADDPVARAIVDEAVASVEETLDAIMPEHCDRLCLVGGLAHSYENRLGARYRALLREPLGDALAGALSLALRHFSAAGEDADA